MAISFFVTLLVQAASAADCAYPQLKNCELPADIKSCIFPTLDAPCKAKATVSEYPLMATANSQQPAAGCYSLNFVRQNPSTYDAAGKCSTQNFPLHLTVNYKTKCLDTQTSCVVGASVEV